MCIEATHPRQRRYLCKAYGMGLIQHRRAKASILDGDHQPAKATLPGLDTTRRVMSVYFSHLSILSIGEVSNTPQRVRYVPPVGFEPTTCGLKVRSSDLTELKGLTRNNYIMSLCVLQIRYFVLSII